MKTTEKKILQVEREQPPAESPERLANEVCVRSRTALPQPTLSGWCRGCWINLGGTKRLPGVNRAGPQLDLEKE